MMKPSDSGNPESFASVFSFSEPLPDGRMAIQASAGTGKTFTLAGLATRFVAERDIPISEFLVVTFTRAATNELRSRVRQRLVDTAEVLSGARQPDESDEVTAYLFAHPDPLHLPRLRRAISDFDSATITTIHGFATQVLGTLGTMSGVDPELVLVENTDDLTTQICADVIAARAASGVEADHLPSVDRLLAATKKVLSIPDLLAIPDPTDESIDIRARLIAELVAQASTQVVHSREAAGTMSFDDVLAKLRDAIRGPGAASVVEALRSRFRVALIDEFQDTDPVQWDIFRILFGQPGSTTSLVLVGDPKQAIYSFRGADITTYLNAVSDHDGVGIVRRSLATNWRSDGAMVEAIGTLLNGTTFGDASIAFTPVKPAPNHEALRIRDHNGDPIPALSIRLAVGPTIARNGKEIKAAVAREAIYSDLTDHLGHLLDRATIPDQQSADGSRRVKPSDIAILVLSRRNAEEIRQFLVDHHIPAVLARGSSVLESAAAQQWRWLLNALARPSDPARARTFALSWFHGKSITWLRQSTDQQIAEIQESLQEWAEILTEHGLAQAFRRIRHATGVTARVLSRREGDRHMTDLDHVDELLHDAFLAGALSPAALLASLDTEPDTDADTDIDGDITSRRVESEADAVQIMTVWVAKGLEFPIVFAPTLWSPRAASRGPLVFHDPVTDRRTLDVASCLGGKPLEPPRAWPSKAATQQRRSISSDEASAEDLRLLYVALTRARHHTAVWWTFGRGTNGTAISKVLFARSGGVIDPVLFNSDKTTLPAIDDLLSSLQPLVDQAGGAIAVGIHGSEQPTIFDWREPDPHDSPLQMQLARLEKVPDRSLGRWSFSAIVNRADHRFDPHDPSLSDSGAADEPDDESTTPSSTTLEYSIDSKASEDVSRAAVVSALATLPAGTSFGTLVHEVLEMVDFTSPQLEADLDAAIQQRSRFRSLDLRPVVPASATTSDGVRLLIDGLAAAIESPLGPQFANMRLRDIARPDRIDEMTFELHLGHGGSHPSDRQIGKLIHHHLPSHDPLRAWASDLSEGLFHTELAGHLTGSIDALLRVTPADESPPRFVVVDYKSNRLHRHGSLPVRGDYSQRAMAVAMAEHHYGLQALLYSVAIHRYLRWRLPGYDPATNLGGVAYLFVRGMAGPDVAIDQETPEGVFTWQVPPALVTDLSDLLDGHTGSNGEAVAS